MNLSIQKLKSLKAVTVLLTNVSPALRITPGRGPKLRDLMPDDPSGADIIIIEIKCTINEIHLNHPQTMLSLPPVHGKIVFHETSPRCQKGGEHCDKWSKNMC